MLALRPVKLVAPWLVAGLTSVAVLGLTGCQEAATKLATGADITTGTYEATATVTYTWQVEYAKSFDKAQTIRQKKFASTSLVNRNGEEPDQAVTGPDDNGLWWPALPPRPTADELESGKQSPADQRSDPQLLKDVKYAITFDHDGQRRTLPTSASVYRTASKAYASDQALELTYGPGNESAIAAAKPIANFEK